MQSDMKQTAPASAPAGAAAQPGAERRPSLPMLLPGGSLTTLGLSGLGLGSMSLGSQDLTSLLESTLQHMQTLSREGACLPACPRLPACLPACGNHRPLLPFLPAGQDMDLLASPKWKALLSWEEEAAGSSPMHLDTGGSSAATRLPPHCGFDSDDAGPVSPGVDQEVGEAALAAAWKLVQAQAQGQGATLVLVPQGSEHPSQQQQQQPRRGGGGGKKRPLAHDGGGSPAAKQPKREQEEEAEAPHAQGRLAAAPSGDAMVLDAEVAAAEAAAAMAAFDAAAAGEFGSPLGLSLSPDVVAGLDRVRLNSIGSPAQQRRLTAAAAAAAVTPSGRRGGVRRGDSNVPMLMAELPGSPTAGAAALSPSPEPAGVGGSDGTPAAPPARPAAVKAEPAASAGPRQTAAGGETGMAAPPPRSAAQGAVPRQQLPSKSHKAVATGGPRACLPACLLPAATTPRLANCCPYRPVGCLACPLPAHPPPPTCLPAHLPACPALPVRRRGRRVHLAIPRRYAAPPDGAVRGPLLGLQLCATQHGELLVAGEGQRNGGGGRRAGKWRVARRV